MFVTANSPVSNYTNSIKIHQSEECQQGCRNRWRTRTWWFKTQRLINMCLCPVLDCCLFGLNCKLELSSSVCLLQASWCC